MATTISGSSVNGPSVYVDTGVFWANSTPYGGTGATGAGTDQIFTLNGQTVTANYSVPSGQNALTAGPITINSAVVVTVPSGSVWTIV